MAHEILTVKLCELEDQFARLSSRIRLTETASRSQLQQEIQALTRECAQTALTLENKLKRSRGEVAAVLADAYGKVDSVLQQPAPSCGGKPPSVPARPTPRWKKSSCWPNMDWILPCSPQTGFSIAGSEFVEMFVGMGASKVRDLFKQAKEKAPCIVFIDEIDAIGQKRNSGSIGGNDEREQTLNQLLTEMDGFEGNNGVMILAATNRPESLDPALTRPGRFDRRVPVELPDLKGRQAILEVHAKKIKAAPDVDLRAIARMAAGASGAELANIINEAALRAVRDGRTVVNQADLEESIEVVIAGYQKKNTVLSDQEKRMVSYHEIGHALVAALQSHSAPVQKITIIPRTSGALGYTMQVDTGDKYLLTKDELENKIATYTGGRAAEEVAFGTRTTGASNDIEQATKLARAMIARYGMSDDFDMVAMETVNNQYLGGNTSPACSPDTQKEIDRRVVELVKAQHAKARKLLEDNRAKLDELAKFLYDKETMTGQEFMDILTGGNKQ